MTIGTVTTAFGFLSSIALIFFGRGETITSMSCLWGGFGLFSFGCFIGTRYLR